MVDLTRASPEKWEPVFRKDLRQNKWLGQAGVSEQRRPDLEKNEITLAGKAKRRAPNWGASGEGSATEMRLQARFRLLLRP
jgi:hypothetical protein